VGDTGPAGQSDPAGGILVAICWASMSKSRCRSGVLSAAFAYYRHHPEHCDALSASLGTARWQG